MSVSNEQLVGQGEVLPITLFEQTNCTRIKNRHFHIPYDSSQQIKTSTQTSFFLKPMKKKIYSSHKRDSRNHSWKQCARVNFHSQAILLMPITNCWHDLRSCRYVSTEMIYIFFFFMPANSSRKMLSFCLIMNIFMWQERQALRRKICQILYFYLNMLLASSHLKTDDPQHQVISNAFL